MSLAEHSPLPVTVAAPVPELPADVAAVVYFVCSEALANAAKHAQATAVSLAVTTAGGRVMVAVADDGRGGADPDRGTGLRGLADRLEALGGALRIESSVGAGTRLAAELPLSGSSSSASRSTGTGRPDPSAGPV